MNAISILSLLPLLALAPSTAQARTEPTALAAAAELTDAEITEKVVAAIQADDTLRYYAGDIQVSTSTGIVTLTGSVPRDSIRMRAAQVAHQAASGSRVVNLVKVNPNG